MKAVLNRFLAVIFACTVLISCERVDNENKVTPETPANVPRGALWVGGADGGVFIKIEKSKDTDGYTGAIYFESTGEIWYQGFFKYTGSEPFEVDKPESYTAWDGDALLLANGGKLVAHN